MHKYRISCYQKSNSVWFTNGGRLIVTDDEYIVKYLFQTVARFDAHKTTVSEISSILHNKGLRLDNGDAYIDLYFFPKTAEKLYELFGLK